LEGAPRARRELSESMSEVKKRVGVIGVGSAGLLNLMHLCVWLDKSWEVYSIHDPKKKILGIGESTNGGFVNLLELATNFTLANPRDLAALGATLKFGSRFVGWREQEWVNPLLNGNVAVHFNNRELKSFAFERLAKLWPDQFRSLLGEVESMDDMGDRVRLRVNGDQHDFDYVVDCRGTPESFDGYTLSDCTLLNRCLVHRIEDYEFQPFTDHIATMNGWMFGVPLKNWKTYGYLYNDTFTDEASARRDMMELLRVTELDSKNYHSDYRFTAYYSNELVTGRICKNGNRALFFEPLIANSIHLYLYANRLSLDYILGRSDAEKTNKGFVQVVQEMEDLVSYYYQGGSMHQSEFWKAATSSAQRRLAIRRPFLEYLGQLQEARKRGQLHTMRGYGWAPQTWQIVDAQLGYNYIEDGRDA
jgi:hypothetical protein